MPPCVMEEIPSFPLFYKIPITHCLIKLESFDLGILCNSLPMNHITTPKPRGQSFKYRWVQFKEAFSGPSSVKGDSVSEQAHSRVQ